MIKVVRASKLHGAGLVRRRCNIISHCCIVISPVCTSDMFLSKLYVPFANKRFHASKRVLSAPIRPQ